MRRVAAGILELAKEQNKTDKPIVIGYDRRFLSDSAAKWVAEVLESPFLFKSNKGVSVTRDLWLEVFERLGLDGSIMTKRLNEISGGQRQRMLFAVIAMLNKDIVLLDEPTSALDGESVTLVVNFIKDMCKNGKCVLVVTHDKFLASVCDRVVNIS